ncbi:iron-sulfur cluster assembly accessory protein [Parasulfuritortus cantonensis]|uniref:Iron-sulfur cluster assembly accessory protein n=1 Tax=Parasulfuritortus cantonensis TaxID=2528202 RepID=A0A4V2NWA3_9PROT|nr:iron-sulfur cluster biosynthesis family protein [Parasulfuritortus cantonensis]TCJ16602.1 iron-sulfur cluster assembly accessory protein [Parasulfuritortus cantonensis]
MINLTKAAAEQISAAARQSGAESMGLRIAARVNDAGMLEFGMGFDDERSNDTIVESYGVTLLVHPSSAEYLNGITIDFSEVTPGESRFVFMMPDQGGCGTGEGGSCGSGGCGSGGCGSSSPSNA